MALYCSSFSFPPASLMTTCFPKRQQQLVSSGKGIAIDVHRLPHPTRCSTLLTHEAFDFEPDVVSRRSANYKPCVWDYDFVQSLRSNYHEGESSAKRMEMLKEVIRPMFHAVEPLDSLELIDALQRLGIGHLFDKEIQETLDTISTSNTSIAVEDLYATALKFRLLRQHGYKISRDVFNSLRDDMGNFKPSICMDTRGMLSLYEASYLSLQGESILDEARAFTGKCLKDLQGETNPNLERLVEQALELPLHWINPRLESRWYIHTCERTGNINPAMLELAKLEFNTAQAMLQKELQNVSRWWKKLGLYEKLSFSRDRSVECYLFSLGMLHDSQFGYGREEIAKVNQLITTIDDVYDLYGSLDELELFTEAVDRWDLRAMEQLPEYMRICFLGLYNTTNEVVYNVLKEQGFNAVAYLKKTWADLCRGYLVEAKWYKDKYTPTLNEYLENSWRTIGGTVILVHTYFLQGENITKAGLDGLQNYVDIIRHSSMVLRLNDDLGTSKDELERGDVPKSIQCYMHEHGVSESVAREQVGVLIGEAWKKMNEERLSCGPYSRYFIDAAMNTGRIAHCVYQYGDGFGVSDNEITEDRLMGLLVQPIPL